MKLNLVFTVSLLFCSACSNPPERPNILMFMTDDQAVNAMSAYGNTVLKTPNMDRIADGGMLFRYAFVVNSLCTPSRVSYMTGRYGHSTGVVVNEGQPKEPQDSYDADYISNMDHAVGPPVMPKGEITFPEILQQNGYCTAFIGKTHIAPYNRDRGYDYYFGFQGQGRYRDPIIAEDFDGDGPFEDKVYEGHITDILGEHARKFISEYRDKEKPFCLLLWFKASHANWDAADRFKSAFQDTRFPRPATWDYDLSKKIPAVSSTYMQIGKADHTVDYDSYMRNYYQTLLGVDENVGKILDDLDRLGLADNTAVLYTSDNGMFTGEFNMLDKRLMYEPSIRVPFLMRYPKMIRGGGTMERMILNIDVAPTMLDLAGIPIPSNMHGRSFVPLLQGREDGWRTDWLYEYYEYPWWHRVHPFRGVRTDRYKYIHWYSTDPVQYELYDLQNDPDEINNLADDPAYAELRKKLHERMQELRTEYDDPDVGKN